MSAPPPTRLPDSSEMLSAADGAPLCYQEWRPPAAPRGLILLVHGFGESLPRYLGLAQFLSAEGFLVGGCDHRGMGRSGGTRGFVRNYDEYVQDLAVAEARLRRNAPPDAPFFVYGHSMGGLVALLCVQQRNAQQITGAIFSGPLLALAFPVPRWQVRLGRLAVRRFPRFRVPAPIIPTRLTHDAEEQAAYARDELALQHTTLGWFFASHSAMERARHEINHLETPTLWLIPGEDKICLAAASRAVFDRLPSPERHVWREYPGLFHELHKERPEDRRQVFADVLGWLQTKVEEAISGSR